MKQSQGEYLTKAPVRERFGWSKRTITRKVEQGCFPCYRLSRTDVRFKIEEILHYVEGKREGGFDGGHQND